MEEGHESDLSKPHETIIEGEWFVGAVASALLPGEEEAPVDAKPV